MNKKTNIKGKKRGGTEEVLGHEFLTSTLFYLKYKEQEKYEEQEKKRKLHSSTKETEINT
jgi:hypothetical protein